MSYINYIVPLTITASEYVDRLMGLQFDCRGTFNLIPIPTKSGSKQPSESEQMNERKLLMLFN